MTILNVVASCGQVYVCDDTVVDGLDFQFRMSLRQPGGAASHRPGVRQAYSCNPRGESIMKL